MSVGESFFASGSGNLIEANDDAATSLLLGIPSRDSRVPVPVTTENAWAVAFKINVAITLLSVSVQIPPQNRGFEAHQAITYTVGFVSGKRPFSTDAQIELSYTVEKGLWRLNLFRLRIPTGGSSRKT